MPPGEGLVADPVRVDAGASAQGERTAQMEALGDDDEPVDPVHALGAYAGFPGGESRFVGHDSVLRDTAVGEVASHDPGLVVAVAPAVAADEDHPGLAGPIQLDADVEPAGQQGGRSVL